MGSMMKKILLSFAVGVIVLIISAFTLSKVFMLGAILKEKGPAFAVPFSILTL